MSNATVIKLWAFFSFIMIITGCAGTKPFNHSARAGDTIMIAAGWKHQFARDKLTVTFRPPVGDDIIYLPNSSGVRASINFYADPTSYMAVGYETNRTDTVYNNARTYGSMVNNNFTYGDPDWWQTMVYVDLPDTLPVGTTQVFLNSSGSLGESWDVPIEIVEGVGSPHDFSAENMGPILNFQLQTLERAPTYEVHFTGETSPHAIQIDLTHDGVGVPYVVSPRGDVKSLNWTDDGQNMRVLLNFTRMDPHYTNIARFKFYVSGGVTGLQAQSVKAFDVNGDPVIGVAANIVNHF